MTNWDLILSHQSYFQEFARPSLFRHLWSLAVEEQFYLLWPLVFAACMTRFGHRRLLVGVIAGAIASSLLMAILFDPANPNRVFYGTDTRATPLLIGVALAFFWHPERLKAKTGTLAPVALDAIGAIGLSMVVITFLTVHDYDSSLYHGGFLLLSIWTAMLIAALAHPAASIGRTLGNPGMRWLGLRSYSFYLWHWPVLELTRPGIDVPLHGPVLFALQLGRDDRAGGPLLPLRRAALPPLDQLAAPGLAAHRPCRDRGRRDLRRAHRRLERDRAAGASGPAPGGLRPDHAAEDSSSSTRSRSRARSRSTPTVASR